jgi:hypothetical protein
MPLDNDTLKVLEYAKKGNTARFVMLTNGGKATGLVCYRKGQYDLVLKRAKDGGGTGKPADGVVEGSPSTLTFKLLGTDFLQPPIQNMVPLRDFVNAGNNLNFKQVQFQIVDTLPEVPDPDAPLTPPPTRSAPLTPQPQQTPQERAEDRRRLSEHAVEKVGEITGGKNLLTDAELQQILTACGTDKDSDFGKIAKLMQGARAFPEGTFLAAGHALLTQRLQAAHAAARKYLESTASDKSEAVAKRRSYCERFVVDAERYNVEITEKNNYAVALCDGYTKLLKSGKEVPYKVCEELRKLLEIGLISADTQAVIEKCCTLIENSNQAIGYSTVAKLQAPTLEQKAKVLLEYGCYKHGGGGSSDVKLLMNVDGTIAAAYKSLAGESTIGGNVLGAPKGCGTLREDVMSSVLELIKNATGLDTGFPKAQIIRHDGGPGALIDGVSGSTADDDELNHYTQPDVIMKIGQAKADEKYEDAKRRILEIPDKVTADSLENVMLSGILAVQWDCKWGNMIVDETGTARPIDGGTAFPTKKAVDRFQGVGGPALGAILKYPNTESHPKARQTMPQASAQLSPHKVAAIMKIDADAIVLAAKARRNKLIADNPEFAANMLEDDAIDVMGDSIKVMQAVFAKKPDLTLEQLATVYERWFNKWAAERG